MSEPPQKLNKDYPRGSSVEVVPPQQPVSATQELGQASTRTIAPERTTQEAPKFTSRIVDDEILAIVFIHGMGTSKPGQMLENYMNASLEWIKRATTEDHNKYVFNEIDENLVRGVNRLERNRILRGHIDDSLVQSTASEIDVEAVAGSVLQSADNRMKTYQPPFIEFHISELKPQSTETEVRKVVAVEAWWDNEFEPPNFKEVAYWALGVAPSLILRHLALLWETSQGQDDTTISLTQEEKDLRESTNALTHDKGSPVPRGTPILWNIVGSLIGVVAQWFICILLVLGAIPFLQKYVKSIILAVTSSFGDVLIYVHDGVRSAAIRSAVERSFQWVFDTYNVKNQKLIVLAHSLGSVIAYDVLNHRSFEEIKEKTSGVVLGGKREVSLVTFGSPLKKTNLLLQLMRDEQRVSLGILFAFGSLFSALLALVFSTMGTFSGHEFGKSPLQYVFALTISIATLFLGIGAHRKPEDDGLSRFQKWGSWLALVAMLVALAGMVIKQFEPGEGFTTSNLTWPGWQLLVFVIYAALAMVVYRKWIADVRTSRAEAIHDPARASQSLWGLWLYMGLVIVVVVSGFLNPVVALLVAALIFSAMTASNPLEEFEKTSEGFQRRQPDFHFKTPIHRWIDFWATRDLVSEFGLAESRYRTTPEGQFDQPIHSRRVTNFNSIGQDHTSFVSNIEQFIAPLTRFMLEQLGVRTPLHRDEYEYKPNSDGNITGSVSVTRRYEEDMHVAMRTRRTRVKWIGAVALPLIASLLILGPGVYRSLGELIVFSDKDTSRQQVARFYNAKPLTCNDDDCSNIRTLPIIADDFSKNLINNDLSRNVILYGLGYGIALVLLFVLTRIFITAPWNVWESAILDTITQRKDKPSRNLKIRKGGFFSMGLVFMALLIGIHVAPGLAWLMEYGLTPLQTVIRFGNWIISPFGWSPVEAACKAGWGYVCAIDADYARNILSGLGERINVPGPTP